MRLAAPDERRRYDAFISYSHEADAQLAPALQDGLHRFAKPWYRLRALHVFRDESSLSANPALWPSVEHALRSSQWFLLLASPAAARSRWVAHEVEFWLGHEPVERLLIVLTDGELVWNDESQTFDREATTSLPRALLGAYEQEPRFVDLRWAQTAGQPDLHDEAFRRAVADVAAPLHGKDKDDLLGEDVRQHTRALRLARSAATTLLVLLLAAVVAAVLAVRSRSEAIAQKDVALSRALAASAIPKLQTDPTVGILLSLEAMRFVEGRPPARTAEARSSVMTAYERNRRLRVNWPAIAIDVAFVGNGRTLVSSNLAGGISLFQIAPKRPLGLIEERQGAVSAVAASADGRVLATATRNGAVRLWLASPAAETRLTLLGRLVAPDVERGRAHRGYVGGLALDAHGTLLASAGFEDRTVRLWDTRSGRQLAVLDVARESIRTVALSADGRRLIAGASHGLLGVWSLTRRPAVRVTPLGPFDLGGGIGSVGDVTAIACNSDCRTFAVASGGGIWLADYEAARRGGHAFTATLTPIPQTTNSGLRDIVFVDGTTVASAHTDGTVRLWDLATLSAREQPLGSAVSTLAGLSDVYALALSPDGQLLASAGAGGIKVWSTAGRGRLGQPLGRHLGRAFAVAVAPGNRLVASGGEDGRVRVWDPATSRQLRVLSVPMDAVVSGVTFSRDGSLLAAGVGRKSSSTAANGIVLWRTAGSRARKFVHNPGGRIVYAVAASPGGDRLASADGGRTIRLWSLPALRPARTLQEAVPATVTAAPVFSGDGATLAAGYQDGAVRLWPVNDPGAAPRSLRVSLDPVLVVALSPDGRRLAEAGRDGEIAIWTLNEDTPSHRLLGGTVGALSRLTFSADGETLASSGADGIRLWDVGQAAQLGDVLGPLSMAADVAFGPTADDLVSASVDGTVRLWRGVTDVAAISRSLCEVAGRSLTRVEWRLNVPDESYHATCGRS